jgi:hypothetical protein
VEQSLQFCADIWVGFGQKSGEMHGLERRTKQSLQFETSIVALGLQIGRSWTGQAQLGMAFPEDWATQTPQRESEERGDGSP